MSQPSERRSEPFPSPVLMHFSGPSGRAAKPEVLTSDRPDDTKRYLLKEIYAQRLKFEPRFAASSAVAFAPRIPVHIRHFGTIMKNLDISIRARKASDLSILSTSWFISSERIHCFLGHNRLRKQRMAVEAACLPDAETCAGAANGESIGPL